MYKTKTFFGCASSYDEKTRADYKFNEWILHNPGIEIIEFRYQQARYGDHSICILYKES